MAWGTASIAKGKNLVLQLSGFGTNLDGIVECTSNGLPDMSENESDEFETNYRSQTITIPNKKWEDYSKCNFFYGADGAAWQAACTAKELGTKGTMTFGMWAGTGTTSTPTLDTTLASFTAVISGVTGPEGDSTAIMSEFTPTFSELTKIS